MQNICFFTCLILLLFSFLKRRKIYDPAFIMYGMWSVILFFNFLGAYGINKASSKAYYYILIGLISFFVGMIIQTILRTDRISISIAHYNINKDKEINYRLIYIIAGISIALSLIDFFIVIRSLLFDHMSLSQIRSWKLELFDDAINPISARRSFLEQTFRVVFLAPFTTALVPIAIIDLFSKEKGKSHLFSISILLILFNAISGGGSRFSILNIILMTVVVSLIYKDETEKIIKNVNKKIVVLIALGIGSIVYFTLKRTRISLFEEIYYYVALCVPLFDYWIPTIEKGVHTNGMLILYGITRIPCMIFEKLELGNGELYELARSYILSANSFRNVGARVSNAFVTPFYYLYLDFGLFGIILGMGLLGYFAEKYFNKVQHGLKKQDLFIYLLIIRGIVFTFVRWDFISTDYALAFFFIFLFFKDKKA